jgi:hypothetical protein
MQYQAVEALIGLAHYMGTVDGLWAALARHTHYHQGVVVGVAAALLWLLCRQSWKIVSLLPER